MRRILLLSLIIAVPLSVAHGSPLRDPFNTPKVALLIVGVFAIGALRLGEIAIGYSPKGLDRLLLPALAFVIPFSIAWSASPDPAYSLSGADYGRYQGLLPYVLAVVLGLLVADAFAGSARKICWALGTAGTVVAAYAILQFLGFDIPAGPGGTRGFVAISTLGNPNFTGGFIAVCLSAMAPFAFEDGPSGSRARKLLFVMAIGLGRSYTQGAWIAGIAGAAAALGIALRPRWDKARTVGIVVPIFLVIGLFGAVGVALAGLELGVLSTVRSRGLTWETTLRAAADKPLLGHGLNTFGEVQPEYRTESALADQRRRGSVPDDPHSVPLAMLVNGGVISLAGWLAVVVWFIFQARKVQDGDLVGAGLVGAVTAYLVQSLSSIDEVTLRVSFWVCLGALAAQHAKDAPSPTEPGVTQSAVRIAVVGTGVLGIVVLSCLSAIHFLEVHRV